MRSRIGFMLSLLVLAATIAFVRSSSGDHWPVQNSPAAAGVFSPVQASVPAVRAAYPIDHQLPSAPTPFPFEVIALGAIVGATSASGRNRGQMIVDSVLHVSRKDDKGVPITRAIPAGILLDDVDADIKLTDDEVDEFTARRVIRYATPEEVERAEQAKANRDTAKVTQAGDATVAGINAQADAERQRIAADFDRQKADALAKHDERVAKDRTEAQQRTEEQVREKTASARTVRATSTAGAQSPRPTAAEARAQAAGGTHSPAPGASPDPGAEAQK